VTSGDANTSKFREKSMVATTTAVSRLHDDIRVQLAEARKRTDDLFGVVREEAIYDRPVPERHRIIFYLGHLEAFDWNLLAERAFGLQPFHATFDKLFAFGIDPVGGGLPTDVPADWPKRREIELYRSRVRETLDRAITHGSAPRSAPLELTTLLKVAVEHRLMHAETLAYLLHRLPGEKKIGKTEIFVAHSQKEEQSLVTIPAGKATLGLTRVHGDEFGWDNEFQSHAVEVGQFAIQKYDVTNAQFLEFLEAGGYDKRPLWLHRDWEWKQQEKVQHPAFWTRRGNSWMYRTMFGEVVLPSDWPVYVSHAEATAYASWVGRRLPTEAQFHRAAYGTAGGEERDYPWGNEAPTDQHGNFDFAHWDPVPVGSYPQGASAFGVHDLLGNGWEWTRTEFAPFPGFEAFSFYPGYSADFFDGHHFVIKGGSPRTSACMLRRSFRNWFQPHYRYAFATFRCVED
jgi:gamma-glutamyl hercynylcysteine S-oxide synthase